MFRLRVSLALAALVALVCVQAVCVYWGSLKVNDYAQHSRLASDILSELLALSANKQRLRVWASQRLMNAGATDEARDGYVEQMRSSAATLQGLAHRDLALWEAVARRGGAPVPPEVRHLVVVTDLLDDNIRAVQSRLLRLVPLAPAADFSSVWKELNQVFDMARGRDLRELINGAIERQRQAVPVARAETERGLDLLRMQAVGLAAVTLAAAVLLALHLNGRLQRPLDRLLTGARELQAGRLGHRIPIGSGDEFDHLAGHINAMAAELQLHRSDAERARRVLEEAVEARTAELSTAHETLKRLDQQRRQLFADLGHELRTPATAIRGEAEIALRGGNRPADDYRQTLLRIVGSVKQLARLTDDLMLVARTEADRLVMHPAAVELGPLLADAADQARALGALNGITVQVSAPADADAPGLVHADVDRLRQALMIVLDNAVRYSHPQGQVTLGWHSNGHAMEIRVRDEGIGIDAEELPRVFERFSRGRRARGQRPDGTGIGLSIAHAIVSAHGGSIDIQSAPQQGTQVRIVLPRDAAAAAPSTAVATAFDRIEEDGRDERVGG